MPYRICCNDHVMCSNLQRCQISSESDLQSKLASKCPNKRGTRTKEVRLQLFVSVLFSTCYFPSFPYTKLLETNTSEISFLVARYASVFLICLNSSLSPIVYCWRHREIREIVKNTVKKIICMNENMT